MLEHDPGDLTCTVEAGIRLSALGEALAASGQRLSLDPPGDPTVGAIVAGNLSGPLRHRFGAPRDLVLGATLVLADGTVASAGGKVVKNVAGYDLARLVCGSEGASPSRTRQPPPASSAEGGPHARRRDRRRAAASSRASRSQLQPSALDVLHPGRVAALFEGSARAVAAQLAAARALVGGEEADDAVWDESRARQADARGRVRFAPGSSRRPWPASTRPSSVPRAGVAYTRRAPRVTRVSQGHERLVEADAARSSTRGSARRVIREYTLRLRPLRVLPADVPDLRALAARRWTRRADAST